MRTIQTIKVSGYFVVGLVSFIFLVPITHVPTSDHYECDRSHCIDVAYYSSISYYYHMAGGIYSTGEKYWLQEPVWN